MVKNIFKNLILGGFGALVLSNAALHYVDHTKQKNIVKEIKQNQAVVQHIGSQLHEILPNYGLETLLDGKYDKNNFLMNNPMLHREEDMQFSKIVESLYDIVSVGRYKNDNGDQFKVHKFGKSIALQDKKDEPYFLTVDHVVQLAKTMEYALDKGKPKTQFTLQETERFLMIDLKNGKQYKAGCNISDFSTLKLKTVLSNYKLDMALFHIPKKNLPDSVNINCFPYGIGNKSELNYGDMVYVIGNPYHKGVNIREGIVSMKEALEKDFRGAPEKYFTISASISSGDSGNPLIALRDGKPEFIGLSQSVHKENLCISAVLGIDAIMEEIGNAGITSLYESMQDKMFK